MDFLGLKRRFFKNFYDLVLLGFNRPLVIFKTCNFKIYINLSLGTLWERPPQRALEARVVVNRSAPRLTFGELMSQESASGVKPAAKTVIEILGVPTGSVKAQSARARGG